MSFYFISEVITKASPKTSICNQKSLLQGVEVSRGISCNCSYIMFPVFLSILGFFFCGFYYYLMVFPFCGSRLSFGIYYLLASAFWRTIGRCVLRTRNLGLHLLGDSTSGGSRLWLSCYANYSTSSPFGVLKSTPRTPPEHLVPHTTQHLGNVAKLFLEKNKKENLLSVLF